MAIEIDDDLRRRIAERAGYRCEYCLVSEDDSFSRHHVDHIISRKHGGPGHESNLAFACVRCNAWKGSDIASLDPENGQLGIAVSSAAATLARSLSARWAVYRTGDFRRASYGAAPPTHHPSADRRTPPSDGNSTLSGSYYVKSSVQTDVLQP